MNSELDNSKIIKRPQSIEKREEIKRTADTKTTKTSIQINPSDLIKQMNSYQQQQQKQKSSNAGNKRMTAKQYSKENFIDKYTLLRKIGNGNFGDLYEGRNEETGELVGIKVDKDPSDLSGQARKSSLIAHEYKFYQNLDAHKGVPGIPRVYFYGPLNMNSSKRQVNGLVMDLLGENLEDLFEKCQKKFSVKTVTMIAIQIIKLIQYVHSKNLIYRDIKPENFLIGKRDSSTDSKSRQTIYIIDFGLAKSYLDPYTKKHIDERDGKDLTGTARYMSINTHKGKEQSRRDDLEAIGHMLFYFLRGSLPWQGLKADSARERYKKIGEVKVQTKIDDLGRGQPKEFKEYLETCRKLAFTETPNYEELINQFENLMKEREWTNDGDFDWIIKERLTHSRKNSSQKKSLNDEISKLKLKDTYNRVLQNYNKDNNNNSNNNNNNNNNSNFISVDNFQPIMKKEPTFCKILKDKFRTKFSSNQSKPKLFNTTTIKSPNERISIISSACNQNLKMNLNNNNNNNKISNYKDKYNNTDSNLGKISHLNKEQHNPYNRQSSSNFCYNFCFGDNNTSNSLYGNFDKFQKNSNF